MLRYAITTGSLRNAADETRVRALVGQCRGLAEAGVDTLLVREKELAAGALVAVCRQVKAVAGRTRVLVSGRADVALAAGLDGVNLGAAAGELTPGQVRQVLAGAWVSVSCHTLDEVARAVDGGASAVLFGPVFGKVVAGREVVAGVGLEALGVACRAAGAVPVLALGGVAEGSAAACVAVGAVGVAGIRMFFGEGGVDLRGGRD